MTASRPKALIRTARPTEFREIAMLARRAFIHDPVMNYFGSHKKLLNRDVESSEAGNLESFLMFLLESCYREGGLITVAVKNIENPSSGESQEVIAAAAYWMPPHKRLALWKVNSLVRSGVIKVLRRWGLTALMRIGFEYQNASKAAMAAGYKANAVKESPNASWYLQLLMTDPAFEGQGFMSALVRDAHANAAPSAKFTLEATTAASRDRYSHLGYELVKTLKLGEGKVDASGIPATGKDAVGVECYSMVNWGITPDRPTRTEK